MALTAAQVWRKYQLAGVPSSGANTPDKNDIIAWGTYLESLLSGSVAGLVYQTATALQADTAHPANTSAIVINDPVDVHNGLFLKIGDSTGGVWVRVGDLPYEVISFGSVAGTANAITASQLPGAPLSPGNKIYILVPIANNSGDTTLNGFQIQTSLSQPLPANALVTGTPAVMVWDTNHYKLLFPLPQDLSGVIRFGTAAGSANAITATPSSVPIDPTSKLYVLTPAVNNTGSTTLNTFVIKNAANSTLSADELVANVPVLMTFDGTNYRLLVSLPVTSAGVVAAAAASATAAASSATAAASSASALANQVHRYDTRAQAAAATIPTGVASIVISRYATGYPLVPANYIPGTNTGPMNFAEAGGHYWELDLTGGDVRAEWWGVKLDGVNVDSTPMNACFTSVIAAGGRKIKVGKGTIKATAQMAYSTSTNFVPGLNIEGAGPEATFIDNQVASNSCLFTGGSSFHFQFGSVIKGLSIITSAAQTASHGIEHKAVYNGLVEDVQITGMTGDGCRITMAAGDADASNEIEYNRCKFAACAIGLNSNFGSALVQVSFVCLRNSSFDQCTTGYRFIGLQGSMINTWFTQCTVAFWNANNGGSSGQFTSLFTSFENNIKAIQIDALQGATWIQTEFAAADAFGVSTQSVVVASGAGIKFSESRVRISSAAHTLFTFGAGASRCVVENSFVQNYTAGQPMYSLDPSAYGIRLDDSCDPVVAGDNIGNTSITLVNGANENFALPNNGGMYNLGGPTAAFSIGGLKNGWPGRRLTLHNPTGQTLTLLANSGASTAANRIYTEGNANVTISPLGTFTLAYGVDNHWHYMGKG